MARAVEQSWRGPLSGIVVTPYGHGVACERLQVVEAAHPVPDESGRRAAAQILTEISGLSSDDLVLCLISGGGSSLLALPAPGVDACRRACGRRRSAAQRRADRRDQLRAQAPVGDHGRASRARCLARAGGCADHLRRARRRPGGDRLGADGRRPNDLPGGARRARSPRRRSTGRRPAPSARRGRRRPRRARRDAQAGRSAARAGKHRRAGDARATRWPRRPPRRAPGACGRSSSATVSWARLARSAAGTPSTPPSSRSGVSPSDGHGAAVGRRDHRDGAGRRARRQEHRIPSGPGARPRRPPRHLCPGGRHRRHRRQRGQRRRLRRPPTRSSAPRRWASTRTRSSPPTTPSRSSSASATSLLPAPR